MDFAVRRFYLVTLMFLFIQDFQPINSQDGFTQIMEFRMPWKRQYFKYVASASSLRAAREICETRGGLNFQLAKVELWRWFDSLNQVIDYKYWLDMDLSLTNQFRFRNGSVFRGAVTEELSATRPYCAFVRKKINTLEVYADDCELEKFAIEVPPCTGSGGCPPQRTNVRMTWYEARNASDFYEGVPNQLISSLDENEAGGYWIDISRSRWQYKYPDHVENVKQHFWDIGEPRGGNNVKCVIVNANGKWMDTLCSGQDNVQVICFNESRITTLMPPKTTTTITTTTTTPTPTTTTASTSPTSTTTSSTSTTTTTTTTTTPAPMKTTTRDGNFQNGAGQRGSSESNDLNDLQLGFIAGTIGLICFVLILAAVLAVMVTRYRSTRINGGASSVSQSTFTMASKHTNYDNPVPPSNDLASNFNIYTSHRYQPTGGFSSKLYKADEAYMKNSVMRNSLPVAPTFRSNITLPPPRW